MFSYFEALHPSQVPGDEEVTDVECEDPANPGKLGPCTRETPKLSIILFKTYKLSIIFLKHTNYPLSCLKHTNYPLSF